jgi:hypothetical protein
MTGIEAVKLRCRRSASLASISPYKTQLLMFNTVFGAR